MKKIISIVFSIVFLCSLVSPVHAETQKVDEPLNVDTLLAEYPEPYVEVYHVTDEQGEHVIQINRQTFVLTIDGEEIMPDVQSVPLTRATVDVSSAVNLSYSIPWRGVATMTAALVAAIPGVGWTVAGAVVGAVAAEGAPLYVKYTQFHSIEDYYSQYYGTYYKKAINKYIKAYKNSISSSNLVYGPVNGDWFDPIRP